eukprot:3180421-Amphidinium_carterae.1
MPASSASSVRGAMCMIGHSATGKASKCSAMLAACWVQISCQAARRSGSTSSGPSRTSPSGLSQPWT